jgi:hypothetical protein
MMFVYQGLRAKCLFTEKSFIRLTRYRRCCMNRLIIVLAVIFLIGFLIPAGSVYADSVKTGDSNSTGIVNDDARDFDSSDPRLTPGEHDKVIEEERKELEDETEGDKEKYHSTTTDPE